MGLPAIVAAGEGKASRAVYGESKVYLEVDGRPLVARIVATLQQVPEVSEVWVVGNAERLGAVLGEASLQAELTKPLHVVPQFRNLYENLWETWRRVLPGAPTEGRDPRDDEADLAGFFLSADLPFATPHELSAFIQRAFERGGDFVTGLVPESSMQPFLPKNPGEPGIEMAYFNVAEDRYRQSNLFVVKPAKLGHRFYIEEMYEHRYQKQLWPIFGLAWRLLTNEGGGFWLLANFMSLQVAGFANRGGWTWLSNWIRARLPLSKVEALMSRLLATDFCFEVTEVGGCAVDVDNEEDYDATCARFNEWYAAQIARGESIYGALPAPGAPDREGA
ncbi:MAG: nucleotidyltransferase family protein [Deltaproteobacteria bacterium]|nr:nucleotidyltransferase family protein [Deltaproteobacteria bacterium]MBW2447007.1 nucleotidyltransferase family protein [Deltaproteobacteria bacterium]